jgi:hypothetical protein
MARRAGKAASRKARQRYQPKTPRPAPAPAPEAVSPEVADEVPTTVREPEPPRRSTPVPSYATGGSTLSARERADYHYVERDLRNIGILSLVMAIILVIAWFVFDAMGIIG